MATRIAVINKGLLQQIDTPHNSNEKPDNLFVAVSSAPSDELLPAKLHKDDGRVYVDGGAFRLQVPEDWTDTFMPYIDRSVIFGIRPDDITIQTLPHPASPLKPLMPRLMSPS